MPQLSHQSLSSPQLQQPYQVGGGLASASTNYISRQADDQLFEALMTGEFCYVLNAHQTGKSSLRGQAIKQLQQRGVCCIGIDLTLFGTRQITREQWYGAIAAELVKGCGLSIEIGQWWRTHKHLTPVRRLTILIDTVLLIQVQQPVVIFLDEIESVLGLNFATDDLFAAISHYYRCRPKCPAYRRLNFVLLGTSTPRCLFSGASRLLTLGKAVPLPNFTARQAEKLMDSRGEWFQNPKALVQRIMYWTGGQPFLTQKLCWLAVAVAQQQPPVNLRSQNHWIDSLVQQRIIHNWEQQDQPVHLSTIRDRLLHTPQLSPDMLALYRRILLSETAPDHFVRKDDSELQQALLLTGLVGENGEILQVQNKIYRAVFNLNWCDRQELHS